ncbi:MAG: arginine deiminase family protein [Bacillota bacterium]|nr:arginine deiminase family protein [Bacillota bacterium]
MAKFNGQSETGKIDSILMKKPETAWKSQENIKKQWQKLHYPAEPNYEKVLNEYSQFTAIIEKYVPEVHYLPENDHTSLDSIYTHDPVIITKGGAILCNMGKYERKPEAEAAGKYLEKIGIPIIGKIEAPGKIEGGDIVWFDDDTVAVGLGYRTNSAGVSQLRDLTKDMVKEVIEVPLPHGNGPAECLHLMSMISPVDRDLAVIYSPLMVVPFRDLLIEKGFRFVEVPDSEYDTFGCNVLALAPRICVMIAGNPKTKAGLEREGVTVFEYPGEDVSIKGGGGPTCLTRPLFRL